MNNQEQQDLFALVLEQPPLFAFASLLQRRRGWQPCRKWRLARCRAQSTKKQDGASGYELQASFAQDPHCHWRLELL